MNRLESIGIHSIFDPNDVKYMNRVIEALLDHGEHTKAIYLDKMIQNAEIVVNDHKVIDLDIIRKRTHHDKNNPSSWEMYAHDIVGHIVHNINTSILAQMKLNSDQMIFKFEFSYRSLFDDFNHLPPFFKEGGIRALAASLLNIVNSSDDWNMTMTKCNSKVAKFTISVKH